jgi:hypothetical protein
MSRLTTRSLWTTRGSVTVDFPALAFAGDTGSGYIRASVLGGRPHRACADRLARARRKRRLTCDAAVLG